MIQVLKDGSAGVKSELANVKSWRYTYPLVGGHLDEPAGEDDDDGVFPHVRSRCWMARKRGFLPPLASRSRRGRREGPVHTFPGLILDTRCGFGAHGPFINGPMTFHVCMYECRRPPPNKGRGAAGHRPAPGREWPLLGQGHDPAASGHGRSSSRLAPTRATARSRCQRPCA